MCVEVYNHWTCGHMMFRTYEACDEWSDAHPGPNVEGSVDCPHYNSAALHQSHNIDSPCDECSLLTPPDSEESD